MNLTPPGGRVTRHLINMLRARALKTRDAAREPFSIAEVLQAPNRILIVPDGRAGGLFLGAAQFWAIRNRYPQATIRLLVRAPKEYIAREIPFVDDTLVYEDFLLPWGGRPGRVIQTLRKQAFDIAFCFSSEDNLCPAYLCHKSGARLRVGFQRANHPFFNIRIIPRPTPCYEAERLALIPQTLGIPPVNERVSWSISKEGAARIQSRLLPGRTPAEHLTGLDVSATTGPGPAPKHLLHIARAVSAQPNARLIVFFDYPDRKIAHQIQDALGPRTLLIPTDDLPKLVALLETCDRLISGNTDLFHLAVAMGRPVTGIFDAPETTRWIPENRKRIDLLDCETLKTCTLDQIAAAVENPLRPSPPDPLTEKGDGKRAGAPG